MAQSDLDGSADTSGSTGLAMSLRVRLSLMMLLQYAIWGAFWSVLSKYLGVLGFSGAQIGSVYATTAVASMISPLVFGQIVDRWLPTQYVLGALHLLGAVMLFLATRFTSFTGVYACILTWALLYFPTLSLTNSLSFHHLPDVGKDFPAIRVFGTIGWIVAGWLVLALGLNEQSYHPILLAGVLSVISGVYFLSLPHTPPKGKQGELFPALRAIGMLREPSFAVFVFVSFIIAIILAGYFVFTAPFLVHVGTRLNVAYMRAHAAPLMALGQCSEIIFMLALPFFLKRLGMKRTLAIGMAAWGVRYAIFALGGPATLIILAILLHGICYDFFFVAAYIHTDSRATSETRASAQAMFNFVVMGVGMFLGSIAFGRLFDHCTTEAGTDWARMWLYPALGAAVALVLFLVAFRPKDDTAAAAKEDTP